jgi:transposase InsO family protein
VIRSDNGREFTADTLRRFLDDYGVRPVFIEKGMPQQNAYVERFNGSMRDEVLNGESFHSVLEAKVVIARWVDEYNSVRPHRGLGMKTPNAFFKAISVVGE